MFDNEFNELQSGQWADPNPSQCPCHGYGWINSDFDVAFECPIHSRGAPHPEDEEGCMHFDWAAHSLQMNRQAWRDACCRSGMAPRPFRVAVEREMANRNGVRSPSQWVDVAWGVAEDVWGAAQDQRAQGMGFSCRLEAAWAAEAAFEAGCRAQNVDPDGDRWRGSPERADADSWR